MTIAASALDDVRASFPEPFALARRRANRLRIVACALLAYVAFALWFFEITPQRLFGGLGNMVIVLRQMVVWKGFLGWDFTGILQGLAETLAMAFLGTLIAAVLAFPLAFVGARNVTHLLVVRQLVRRCCDLLRGIDSLIWALVFVRAVGLGPLAGVLAIITNETGTFGKIFSEAVENTDPKPVEGVRSTGGSRLQELRFAVLPQVAPVMLSQVLYLFESNTRSATILGVVGAGGIGLQLSERIRVQYWDQAAFIIILVLIVVAVIDTLSRILRERLIGRAER